MMHLKDAFFHFSLLFCLFVFVVAIPTKIRTKEQNSK